MLPLWQPLSTVALILVVMEIPSREGYWEEESPEGGGTLDSLCSAGMTLRSLGVELHCRCIQTESRPIGRHIEKVELIPANSHCEETEIIATLKQTGQEVCLDPAARWVKRVIERILNNSKRR